MSIVLEAKYDKRCGLPFFSSHSYGLSVRMDLADLTQLDVESQRLYRILQAAVDREIQIAGFVPSNGEPPPSSHGKNGDHAEEPQEACDVAWQCSGRQRELILTIAEERQLALTRVEALAQESFGKELRRLNRSQASRIITRLLTA
jgi:hypothetical protein